MSYSNCDIVYVVFPAGGANGDGVKPGGMRCVSAGSSGEGWCLTGQPWRLCGRHKKTAYRLPVADVM